MISSRITTSWDDGHPLDLRVGDLLCKYGLTGTFYVPRHASRGVMSDAEIRGLSTRFGVGAHTIDHVDVTTIDDASVSRQMQDSKAWIESLTGRSCPLFCFPKGRFHMRHLALARSCGYTGVRTTELLSTNPPATASGGLRVIPTSVQARPHATISYVRNALKRASVVGLSHLLSVGTDRGWPSLAHHLASLVDSRGGVFHLWGHSWEIQELNQWDELERVLSHLSQLSERNERVTNEGLCADGE